MIEKFRKNHELHFSIKLEDFPPTRFETKIVAVKAGLIGAKASNPSIACIIDHSGEREAKHRNGQTITMMNKPRQATVSAAKTMQQFEQIAFDESSFKDSFLGRSPITSWYLYIEKFEMNSNNVDLSLLSEIRIAIEYNSFLVTS